MLGFIMHARLLKNTVRYVNHIKRSTQWRHSYSNRSVIMNFFTKSTRSKHMIEAVVSVCFLAGSAERNSVKFGTSGSTLKSGE
jgi:hypothetical protein